MNITKIRALTISAALVLGFSAAAASAGTSNNLFVSDGVNKYVVRYSDLDLSKVDGAATMYSRLRVAAGIVCGPLESRSLLMETQYRACVSRAIAGAVNTIDRPLLSEYHESHAKGARTAVTQLAKAN